MFDERNFNSARDVMTATQIQFQGFQDKEKANQVIHAQILSEKHLASLEAKIEFIKLSIEIQSIEAKALEQIAEKRDHKHTLISGVAAIAGIISTILAIVGIWIQINSSK